MMAQRRGGLSTGSGEIHSPMPGLIVAIPVEVGQEVAAGQTVVILESMKMQNELKAPIAGVVETVNCHPKQTVEKNALLMVIKPVAEG
jgi:biotin carboxyl carrier protein